MNKTFTKFHFYLALYATRAKLRTGSFREVPCGIPSGLDSMAPRRVFFWTPAATAGAQVIVHDVVPEILAIVREKGLPWEVAFGPEMPPGDWDDLVCFKAVPTDEQRRRAKRLTMLICDQADVYWGALARFDALVATSSRPFARLVSARNQRVFFIGESEPARLITHGAKQLSAGYSRRSDLLWHGGAYSQNSLRDLQPVLAGMKLNPGPRLHVVSGSGPHRTETWGQLTVQFTPWSVENLKAAAETARLGIVPARTSLKSSWLKPASRVRRLFALGVPTIGDRRVPDVVTFMREFDGPAVSGIAEWKAAIENIWGDETRLGRLASAGHGAVAKHHSTARTARQWVRFLADAIQE